MRPSLVLERRPDDPPAAELVPHQRPAGLPHDALHGWCRACGAPTRSVWLKACSTRSCVGAVVRMHKLGADLAALGRAIARFVEVPHAR